MPEPYSLPGLNNMGAYRWNASTRRYEPMGAGVQLIPTNTQGAPPQESGDDAFLGNLRAQIQQMMTRPDPSEALYRRELAAIPDVKYDPDKVYQQILGGGGAIRASQPFPAQGGSLLEQSLGAPTQSDYAAAQARARSTGAGELAQRLQGIPVAQPGLATMPDVPALSLPQPPQRQTPQANPLASVAAGILGLVSPINAGEFGAEALHGALQANQRQYEDALTRYQQDYQRTYAEHEDTLKRAEMQQRVDAENRALKYEASKAEEAKQKQVASVEGDRSEFLSLAEQDLKFAPAEHQAAAASTKIDLLLRQAKDEADLNRLYSQEKARLAGQIAQAEAHRDTALANMLYRYALELDRQRERKAAALQSQAAALQRTEIMAGVSQARPIPVAPGGTLFDRTSGQPIYTNPALPVMQPEGSALVQRGTGKVIAPPRPKTSAQSQKDNLNLQYRQHHDAAAAAYKELQSLGATQAGGSGTTDIAVAHRIKNLWDIYYKERDAAQKVGQAAPAVGGKSHLSGQRTSKPDGTYKLPNGTTVTVKGGVIQ